MAAHSSPPLSVIITSHDYERYVGDAIASALDQRGAATEVIVVDDGSTDGSREVIESFGDRVTAIFQANAGQAVAQNRGYRASSGGPVIFLDADDMLMPDAASNVLAALRDPQVAKVHWSMPVIDAEGRRTGEIQDPELAEGDLRRQFFEHGPLSDETMPSPPSSGNAYPRWYLDQVMPIPEDVYFRAPDEYLFGLAPAFGPIARIEPQSCYRVHDRNASLLRPFEKKLSFQREHWETMVRAGREVAARQGLVHDELVWERHAWWPRTARAVSAIEAAVPAGERLALIDQTLLGFEPELRGRTVIPFPEQDGEWAGNPADDADAIVALERMRAASISYFAVAWPSFWWFEEYPGLARELRAGGRVLIDDEDLLLVGPDGG
ncbi:MAG TPA: glycosyltransferase family A protein [Solirubrobacteraceae bacterium]